MMSVLKNDDGYIEAYIEWEMINSSFLAVKHIWIHESLRSRGMMNGTTRHLALLVIENEYSKGFTHVGWEREHHVVRWYPAYKVIRRLFNGKE